jgi:hypothetical protein
MIKERQKWTPALKKRSPKYKILAETRSNFIEAKHIAMVKWNRLAKSKRDSAALTAAKENEALLNQEIRGMEAAFNTARRLASKLIIFLMVVLASCGTTEPEGKDLKEHYPAVSSPQADWMNTSMVYTHFDEKELKVPIKMSFYKGSIVIETDGEITFFPNGVKTFHGNWEGRWFKSEEKSFCKISQTEIQFSDGWKIYTLHRMRNK